MRTIGTAIGTYATDMNYYRRHGHLPTSSLIYPGVHQAAACQGRLEHEYTLHRRSW